MLFLGFCLYIVNFGKVSHQAFQCIRPYNGRRMSAPYHTGSLAQIPSIPPPHQAAAPRRGLSHISTHIFCFPLAHFRRLRYN